MDFVDFILRYGLIVVAVFEGMLIISCIIMWRVYYLKRQVADLRIKMTVNRHEEMLRYQVLADQLKQRNKTLDVNDIQRLFADRVKEIESQFPALTETDIQVLTLIGLGVDNTDILQLTDMSKRTYYKRRQLIAQRMNTTAAQLDQIARNCFTPKIK